MSVFTPRCRLVVALPLACLLAVGAGVYFQAWPWAAAPAPRARGLLRQGLYVWQRAWEVAPMGAALDRAAPTAPAGFVVLGAEVGWPAGPGRPAAVARPDVDWTALRAPGRPVGLALRVGRYTGPFQAGGDPVELFARLMGDLLARAAATGVSVAEVQVDFDASASQLEGYAVWLGALRARLPPEVPLAVTVLPSWLLRHPRALAGVVRAAGNAPYVLQVHSLEAPADGPGPLDPCDPGQARAAVEAAGRLGLPFRVALPTYSYLAAFNARGHLLALLAEDDGARSGNLAAATVRLREVRADPGAMAALVAGWTGDRPVNLTGLLWYRLPVDGDTLNWRWATLAAVMAGRAPRPALAAAVRWTEPGRLAEVELANVGEEDAVPPAIVRLRWPGPASTLAAADGVGGWTWRQEPAGPAPVGGGGGWREVRFRPPAPPADAPDAGPPNRLAPAGRRVVGWVRFDAPLPPADLLVDTLP